MNDDIRRIRELIELVAGRVEPAVPLDDLTVGVVLMILDSHNLLNRFEGEAEWYHLRVQQAYRDALRRVL
jgi:hypothetical protein